MKGLKFLLLLFVSLAFYQGSFAQKTYRLGFYNFENLFFPEDDSLTRDEEFTPDGMRRWNNYKYFKKLDQLSRVISIMGEWSSIDVLAFCEVEEERCIRDLIQRKALQKTKYKVSYAKSEDRRGIDVGLIYNSESFRLHKDTSIKVRTKDQPEFRTRDILHSILISNSNDTIHFFVNHWPSKYRGKLESEPLRLLASNTLSEYVQRNVPKKAMLICMGDFNDAPEERSILNLEKNTAWTNLLAENNNGTHKYQADWSTIDQAFVSQSFLKAFNPKLTVFNEKFLLQNDDKFLGEKPRRSFNGMVYDSGGFSDHLPIYVDIISP